jgi:serine/threonine-protein kinase RsbW
VPTLATTVELEIPPRSAYVAVVRLALAALARAAGLADETVEDLKIAVSEACANAVLSSEAVDSNESVLISWTEEASRVVVEVADRGETYEIESSDVDTQGFQLQRGMSVALMKSLVGDFGIRPREGGGMLTHMVFPLTDTAPGT